MRIFIISPKNEQNSFVQKKYSMKWQKRFDYFKNSFNKVFNKNVDNL